MRSLLLIILSSFILLSCGQNKKNEPAENITPSENFAFQATINDSTGNLKMMQSVPIPDDSLNKDYMINYLNQHFSYENTPLMKIEFVKQSHDTIFLHIPDATYLTQRSGSSGAEEHMATMVYNLTEIPGITFVNFDFEEGDHAQPGTYSRASFVIDP